MVIFVFFIFFISWPLYLIIYFFFFPLFFSLISLYFTKYFVSPVYSSIPILYISYSTFLSIFSILIFALPWHNTSYAILLILTLIISPAILIRSVFPVEALPNSSPLFLILHLSRWCGLRMTGMRAWWWWRRGARTLWCCASSRQASLRSTSDLTSPSPQR